MRIPQKPPDGLEVVSQLVKDFDSLERFSDLRDDYFHWDKLRRLPLPKGIGNHLQWWTLLKYGRSTTLRPLPLSDCSGESFQFSAPEQTGKILHEIDLGAGGNIGFAEPITNPQSRNFYLVNSIMEEAITSSQLEGAVTTREVAKEMLRTGRSPRDTSEQMILNNYATMQLVRELKNQELTPELVLRLHSCVTADTLAEGAVGRLRVAGENITIGDDYGTVYHTPPSADELVDRMITMCDFANGKIPDFFIHPVIRGIILHFWLAYDHPFIDGNGRTARALFYWAMLKNGYWLFEYVSISHILKKSATKYARSFLYTETDDNDLTYFILAQMDVIQSAIYELHSYIERKSKEKRDLELQVESLQGFNHRQVGLLRHALSHPGHRYTFTSHKTSNGVTYQTARTDLMELGNLGVLDLIKRRKQMVFISPVDLLQRLGKLQK